MKSCIGLWSKNSTEGEPGSLAQGEWGSNALEPDEVETMEGIALVRMMAEEFFLMQVSD